MDMRQKLLPIFFKEAEINLGMLRHFLLNNEPPVRELDDLEAAFRAAHTLKGTSQLVQADSIHSISRRLEALLERHFSRKTSPSKVEFEAMELAVEWLSQLVVALRDNQAAPKSFVSEALQALDLAESFPGATPLVELLDSAAEQRAPQLNDPFAADPDLQLNEEEVLRLAKDPFADDPEFGLELDVHVDDVDTAGSENAVSLADDPFSDDAVFDPDPMQAIGRAGENIITPGGVPYDPFAEDQTFLDEGDVATAVTSTVQSEEDEGMAGDPVVSLATDSEREPDAELKVDESAAVEDLFADDPSVEVELEKSGATTTAAAQPAELQQFDRAKDVAESLLLPKTDEQPRRDYVCCTFSLCGRSYYLPIKYMLEISEQKPLLPLPLAPAVVKGLINLRGQVMPVIDLSVLHRGQTESGQVRRLVVAEHKGEKLAFLAEGIPYLSEVHVGEKIDLPKFISVHRIRGVEV